MPTDPQAFLEQHGPLDHVDLILPDLNGLVRGKRIEGSNLHKVIDEGILLPGSVFGCDITGDTCEETGLGFEIGDRDYPCQPLPETLCLTPWLDKPAAQMFIEMRDDGGEAFEIDPRIILARVTDQLRSDGWQPTVAVELEFYLVDARLSEKGLPQPVVNPATGQVEQTTQVYLIQDLDDFSPFISRVQHYAEKQGLPAYGAISEYAPGQFEINLKHRSDPVAACDDAILLKRTIKAAAQELGLAATFMPKPFIDRAGSGTHIHASFYDQDGQNVFAASEALLHQAVAGLQATFADSTLICAPHANSYRRFQPEMFVPMSPCWGYNNRTVALRIPEGPEQATRIEHRVAGADANPYLLTALVLAGMHHGLRGQLACDDPITGNAYEQTQPTITTEWLQAIEELEQSAWIAEVFGERFQRVYAALKRAEYQAFQQQVTPLEVDWYLSNV